MADLQNLYPGLTSVEVDISRSQFGKNEFLSNDESGFVTALKEIIKEPMFILLMVTATIYFISGKMGDGLFMVAAILLVAAISLYQDSRSRNALTTLKNLTQPTCRVIRNSETISIKIEEIVIGDYIMVEEGISIPADAEIIQANDFSINESILTGESLAVFKNEKSTDNIVFQGTSVAGGLAICRVTAIGNQTRLGKIGKSVEALIIQRTPLQIQITAFVKMMAIIGVVVFLIVWSINFISSKILLDSLLKALTLAMSILPEEIPVAFTTFMALGAWRLLKMGIIVKQTQTVETLGSATVICTDKTGTITENKMELAKLYIMKTGQLLNMTDAMNADTKELITLSMWSSEPIPFDPMELAIHHNYLHFIEIDERPLYALVHEYPLSGRPPMMTHIFENKSGQNIIAAKGAPEALFEVSNMTKENKVEVFKIMDALTLDGYRVLGVGQAIYEGKQFPEKQQDFRFMFKGLIAFYDPPKKNISAVFQSFYRAGMQVKIITGDNAATTRNIAEQVGFVGAENSINGDELMKLDEATLNKVVLSRQVFARMFPEAKLKIINALKASGQIVAMTGDGVNDGPALKAAHIGIAMGERGSDIAKRAASLILRDDDLAKMVDAVEMGRKIYSNLKKAIQYIISIHIPIILTVFIPLALGWVYPNIFSPLHIIFLEMIMGPTCSIIYENEPAEKNSMLQKPRPFTNTFFKWDELIISIIQGLIITVGTLCIYQYAVKTHCNEATTRSMVFVTLVSANVFLTLVNRSFYYSIITTARYHNNLIPVIIGITLLLTSSILMIQPFRVFFEFDMVTTIQVFAGIVTGMVSVIWFELIKWYKRRKRKVSNH